MLHPVAVMGIDINIGDTRRTRGPQRQDRQYGVIEIAKPTRPIGKAVIGAAAGVIYHTACPQ